ncbi:hypothetical protein NDU88_003281 [Pleurodeles waltl]|uniref:Uncharacterized protein n=1 Tax=Pleurodeles waltl TaxID=8319 RepID=A0AAV7SD04_PLEWA|nr:hypothetical protein NDU88_003281 [Pleurodeles waltl]
MNSNAPTRPPRPADAGPGGCRCAHLESNAGSHRSQIAAPAHTRGAAQPSPAPRLGSWLHISMSYAAHLFASDATGVAAAVLSGPLPLGRRHRTSSPGPIHTFNPAYIGPYWCVQRQHPVSQAPGRHHGVPLGRLRATAWIRSDLDGLNRPVAAPRAAGVGPDSCRRAHLVSSAGFHRSQIAAPVHTRGAAQLSSSIRIVYKAARCSVCRTVLRL